jgi:hypothetical protein
MYFYYVTLIKLPFPGADPGFKVRRGGVFKIVWGISCEKSRFYAKKSYFFPILGGSGRGV